MLREPALDLTGRSALFLDVDGALNGHERGVNGYCSTRPPLVDLLNQLIGRTDCLLVISSAWRYLVHNGHMTVVGLENLFLTHGLDCRLRVAGILRPDLSPMQCDRGPQIQDWLDAYGFGLVSYAVVDDLDLEITSRGHPFVQTDGTIGMTAQDAARLEVLLGPVPFAYQARLRESRQWNK